MNVAGPLEWFQARAIPKNGNRVSNPDEAVMQRPIETLETIQERLRLAARASAHTDETEIQMSEHEVQ